MSNDGPNPTADRTIHIDQYTGRVLADVGFADYSPYAKAMAVGIAFHEGDLGVWNLVLNTVFCLSVVLVSVSGAIMWWKRPPGHRRQPPVRAAQTTGPAILERRPPCSSSRSASCSRWPGSRSRLRCCSM